MKVCEFTVQGDVVAQGRPRITTISGHARAYDPKKSADYKAIVSYYAQQAMNGNSPTKGACYVIIQISKRIPQGMSKKARALALSGNVKPLTKPDVDNVAKGIMDAMTGIVWIDDKQVVDLHVTKKYAEFSRVEVLVCI